MKTIYTDICENYEDDFIPGKIIIPDFLEVEINKIINCNSFLNLKSEWNFDISLNIPRENIKLLNNKNNTKNIPNTDDKLFFLSYDSDIFINIHNLDMDDDSNDNTSKINNNKNENNMHELINKNNKNSNHLDNYFQADLVIENGDEILDLEYDITNLSKIHFTDNFLKNFIDPVKKDASDYDENLIDCIDKNHLSKFYKKLLLKLDYIIKSIEMGYNNYSYYSEDFIKSINHYHYNLYDNIKNKDYKAIKNVLSRKKFLSKTYYEL